MSKPALENSNCEWFFEDLAASRDRVLFIDYDGTIAPFSADHKRALPYPVVPGLLERIMKTCGTSVVMLTGGRAHRIPPLLGIDPPPEVLGNYGLERLCPDGRYHGVDIPDDCFDALTQAEVYLEEEG